ncbi:MAG: hypothetical protein ISR74_06775 [Candidatus Thioglobus sp.]|nr:hypothetical protein [Candidatus Thioglobus sp.]
MDRKEFIALALSPLLVPLVTKDKPAIGKFTVTTFNVLSSKHIYGDIPIRPPTPNTYKEVMLTIYDGKEVILRKEVCQQSNYFDEKECQRRLKWWVKKNYPEMKISYV